MKPTNEQDEASLGSILQQAREQQGLTQAQVATQLNLKIAVISQMESEQWDPSVAPTFMRGYLRSYARLLKLSETEILQAFAVQTAYLRHHPKEMKSFSHKTRRDAAENRFMLASYFVVVLLLGLFLVSVWQTHMADDKPVSILPQYNETAELPVNDVATVSEPSASQLNTQLNSQLPAASVPSGQPQQNTTALNTTAQNAADQNNSVPSGQLASSPEPQPAITTPAVPKQTQPTPSAQNASQSVASTEPVATPSNSVSTVPAVQDAASSQAITTSAAVQTQSAALPATAIASASSTLTMAFSQGCWVSVEDGTGKRLAYQMYQPGQSVTLTGVLPLKVTLGEPTAVTLQLNNVSIDLSKYQAGKVARLTFNGPV